MPLEDDTPGVVPVVDFLGDARVAGLDVEAELAGWGLGGLV